jgi:hypothetical protein
LPEGVAIVVETYLRSLGEEPVADDDGYRNALVVMHSGCLTDVHRGAAYDAIRLWDAHNVQVRLGTDAAPVSLANDLETRLRAVERSLQDIRAMIQAIACERDDADLAEALAKLSEKVDAFSKIASDNKVLSEIDLLSKNFSPTANVTVNITGLEKLGDLATEIYRDLFGKALNELGPIGVSGAALTYLASGPTTAAAAAFAMLVSRNQEVRNAVAGGIANTRDFFRLLPNWETTKSNVFADDFGEEKWPSDSRDGNSDLLVNDASDDPELNRLIQERADALSVALKDGDGPETERISDELRRFCARFAKLPGIALELWDTQVSDVGALSGLTNLQTLNLRGTQVSDVGALSGLTNLQTLDLWDTQVSDVGALSGLTNLQTLDLRGTPVSDVGALSGLTNLQTLNLWGTPVSDVGALSGLTNLQTLDLSDNQVSDVGALSGLTNLQSLDLTSTEVSDVGALSGLTNLQTLDLRGTQVSDVGALSGLTNLQTLNLTSTEVSDVGALSGLTNLQWLDLMDTPVSDVGALSGLTNLQWLDLTDTQVSDVGALAELPNLDHLFLPDGVRDNRRR